MSLAKKLSQAMHSLSVRMIQRQEDERTRHIVDTLQSVSLFETVTRGALREISQLVHPRDFLPGEVIYHVRDPGLGLYIVQRGSVQLLVGTETEKVVELGRVEAFEVFGVMSLFSESRRLETARAIEDTRVLGLFTSDLEALMHHSPTVAARVSFAVARHVSSLHYSMVKNGGRPP